MPAATSANRSLLTRLGAACSGGALALVCSACLLVSVGQAQLPHNNYLDAGTPYSAGSGNPFAGAGKHMAIDPANHNLLVADSGGGRVAIFKANGTALEPLDEFGSGVLGSAYGIAIDSASHFVYVSDRATERIVRFSYTGGADPVYTQDLSYTSPTLGSAPGQVGSFEAAIAIDPSTHDLLVADPAGNRVSRFTDTGAYVSSFDGSDAPGGAFVHPADIAVGPTGTIVVVDTEGPLSASRAERFAGDGSWLGTLATTLSPESVAVDQVTGSILVSSTDIPLNTYQVLEFIEDEQVSEAPLPSSSGPIATAIDSSGSGYLYAYTSIRFFSSLDAIEVYTPVRAPGVALTAAADITATSATFSGTVDPGGQTVTPHFEYSVDGVHWTALSELAPVSGGGETPVQAPVTGLEPNRHYLARLVASNESVSSASAPVTFDTQVAAPEVATLRASELSVSGAHLAGQINPLGLQTTYHFEYGQSTAYGQRMPLESEAVIGNGHASRSVSEPISHLQAGTLYHYRLVASNSAGTSYGADETFTTPAAPEAPRAYELVSPLDVGLVIRANDGFQASSDGNGFAFEGNNAVADEGISEGAPGAPRYASVREGAGWLTHGLDAPLNAETELPAAVNIATFGLSDDTKEALVVSNHALAPGAVTGQYNIYLHDVQSGAEHLIGVAPQALAGEINYGFVQILYGASKSWDRLVLYSSYPLVPGSSATGLFEYANGHLQLVSLLPDGTPADASLRVGVKNPVSEDGSRLTFGVESGSAAGVYLREDGHTIAISVSHRAGDPDTVQPAHYSGSSSDGRYIVFRAIEATPLTTDAPPFRGDMYRYDADHGTLEYLHTPIESGVAEPAFLEMSDDGSTVFFYGPGGLYAWRNGHSRLIGPGFEYSGLPSPNDVSASPDGHYLAVESLIPLTSQNIRNPVACATVGGLDFGQACGSVYLMDSETGERSCASCSPDGSPPAGHAAMAGGPLPGHHIRSVDDAGQVFFETPSSLVSEDTNGTADVYEYSNGQPRLISRGTRATQSYFADASSDGKNVFIVSNDQLVAQDKDKEFNVYDARVEGGLPEPGVAPAACSGDGCEGEPADQLSLAIAGSVTFSDESGGGASPGTSTRSAKARISVSGKAIKGSAFALSVRVPAKGRVAVSGAGLRSLVKAASKAMTLKLKVSLKPATAKKLRARHKLKVKVRVTYTPAGGSASASTVSVALKA